MKTIPNLYGLDVDAVWVGALAVVLNEGRDYSPRGLKTREVLGLQLRIANARGNVLVNPARKLSYRFAVAEWLWIQSGLDDVATIAEYNKNIAQFSDDGLTFAGAYGPRLLAQWPWIVEQLRTQADTRQAVGVVFAPTPGRSKDVPCTLSFQWLLRDGKLHCVATMRSSDLWLGLPYDIFNFTQLTNSLAGEVGVDVGSFVITLGSAHLYEHNQEDALRIVHERERTGESWPSIASPHLPGMLPPDYGVNALRQPNPSAHWTRDSPYYYYELALARKGQLTALEALRHASLLG